MLSSLDATRVSFFLSSTWPAFPFPRSLDQKRPRILEQIYGKIIIGRIIDITWLTFWRQRWPRRSFVPAVGFFHWTDFPNWTFLTIFGFLTWIQSGTHLLLYHVIKNVPKEYLWRHRAPNGAYFSHPYFRH